MQNIDYQKVSKDLKIDARGLGIPDGAADLFIEQTLKSLKKSLESKPYVTESDLNRYIAKELKKYNADFAYVYQNRGTIV